MKRKRQRMALGTFTSKLIVCLLSFLVAGVAGDDQTVGFGASTVECTSGETGYDSIASMNLDMENELTKIRDGEPAQVPYMFLLCPQTVFDATQPLLPRLNAVFSCGASGDPANGCTFSGGDTQIQLDDLSTDFPEVMVSFVGMTFSGFATAAIGGNAGSTTTVDITRSIFTGFDSMFLIQQSNDAGAKPFNLNARGVGIVEGTGGSAFLNAGGEMTLEDVAVNGATLTTLVSTGAASQGSLGSTFLRRITASDSDVEDMFVVMNAADIDAMSVTIDFMRNMDIIFKVSGAGSTATVEDLVIANNDFAASDPPVLWTAFDLEDSAMATVANAQISDSTNIRHLFSAASASVLNLQDIDVDGLVGGRAVDPLDVSAVVFSNLGSTVNAIRVDANDISLFTAFLFGNANSDFTVVKSCLGDGNTQATVYMSEASTVVSTDNFASSEFESSVCGDAGTRLVQENPGSGCFQANRTDCAFTCESFFDAEECMSENSMPPSLFPSATFAPSSSLAPSLSSAPTITGVPSTAPSVIVVTSPPNVTIPPGDSESPSLAPSTQLSNDASAQPSAEPTTTTGAPSSSVTPSLSPTATDSPTATPGPSQQTLAPAITAPTPQDTMAPSAAPSTQLVDQPSLRPTTSLPEPIFPTIDPASDSPTFEPTEKPKPICDYCGYGKGKGKKKKKKSSESKKGKGKGGKGKHTHYSFYDGDGDHYDDDSDDCYCPVYSYSSSSSSSKSMKGKGKGSYVRHPKATHALHHIYNLDRRP